MKEELKIGDLIRFDDEYRSAARTPVSVMATGTGTGTGTVTAMAPMTYMTNFTKYKNGIALVVDIISNRKNYKYDGHDIFKIILNGEVRYLCRTYIQRAKKVS